MKDYPVIKITLLFICGILLKPLFNFNIIIFLIAALFISALLILLFYPFKNKYILVSILLLIIIIFLGSFRASVIDNNSYLPQNLYKTKNFKAIGRIIDVELKRKDKVEFLFSADTVFVKNFLAGRDIKLIGRIKVENRKYLDSIYNNILPGNIISLSGTFTKGREMRNPGEFDYNEYLRNEGFSGVITAYNVHDFKILCAEDNLLKSKIFQIRKTIYNRILNLQSEKTASLLKSLLLADRSDIDYETKTEFINTGVVHVLAVSGLHTGFVILFILIIFGRLNIYLRSIVVINGLILFMFITGLPVSVFRASVMAIIIIIAFILNRSTNLFNSLALAALIILIVNPDEIYSPGFQLSFSAVLSIGIIFPLFQKKIKELNLKNSFLKYTILLIAVSLSVQIGTLPITLTYFGKLSIIAIAANLIVIPLIGLILLVGIVTLLINILSPFVAGIYAAANDLFTHILFKLIKIGGDFKYSFVWIRNFSTYDALIFYFLLILFLFYYKRFQSAAAKFSLLFLIIINFLIYSSLDNKELFRLGEINLLMIDVGQGDSFLLQMPGGKTALIDAGQTASYFDNGEQVIIPLLNKLGIDKIDYGFVSHLDSDHYGGFVSLIHYERIKKIYKSPVDSSDRYDVKFENYLGQNNIPFYYYNKRILKLNNSRIYFLFDNLDNNFSKNNRSGIIKIIFGKNSFLFTGDAETKREKILIAEYKTFLKSDILKVGHHGSSSGSSSDFLNAVKPKISLISAGIQNKFDHPSKKILDRLELIKSTIYRTDKLGAVLFRSNGDSVYSVNWRDY